MAQFKAQAGKIYKNPITGMQVSYTEEELRSPATGMLSSDFQEYNANQSTLPATGATQSPSSRQDVSGAGAIVTQPTPARDVNVISSQTAQGRIDSLPPPSQDVIKKSALDYQYSQLREQAKKRADEEAALKMSLQSVKGAEATSQFLEGQKSQRAADFKLGRSGTYYQDDALSKSKQDFDRQMYRFQIEDQLISNQIRDAWENNDTRLARELQTKKDSIDEKRRQDQKDAEDSFYKRMDLASKLEDRADKTFEKLAKSGVEVGDEDLAFIEERYGLDSGMGRVVYEAHKSEQDSKKTKEDLDRMVQKVQLQTGLINLQNLPEKTRLEMAKMVEDLGSSSVRTANSIFEAMKNQPVGVPLVLPDATYLGVPGAGVVERSSDGTSVLSWKDSQGRIKTQEFSFMPDPKDSEQIYLNGVPALRDRKSGTVYPITDGPDVTNRNAGWTKTFPVGSRGGQCGEFCHNFVEDYPYGLNTLEQKKAAINVKKGENYQIGDILVQNIGGSTGHVSVVDWVGTDENGKQIVTMIESNLKNDERVTAGRPLRADDPTIEGAFRGRLSQKFITGSDRPSTPEPTAQLQADTRSFDQGVQTYGMKIPTASPFIVGPQSSTQYQDSLQNELAARSAAAQLVGGDIKDIKDIDQKVRSRAIEIASANGYAKPGEIKPYQVDKAAIRQRIMDDAGFTPAPGSQAEKDLNNLVEQEASAAKSASDDLVKGFNNLITRGGIKKDQRDEMKAQWSEIINSGNLAEAESFLESAAVDIMPPAQKGEFSDISDGADFAASAAQRAANLRDNPLASGPYRELIEKAKPFLTISKDPDIARLRQEVENAQAKIRRSYFGTSVTTSESGTADSMLVNFEKDDINTVIDKLGRMNKYLQFQNDKQVNRILGLPKPNINDYVPQ